jgi:PAN domain
MSTCEQAGFDLPYCESRAIPSNYTIGTPFAAATWKNCADACQADAKCKAYTYVPSKKQCTKKSDRKFIYQAGSQSGPVLNMRPWWVPPCTPDAQTKGFYKCNSSIASSANHDAPVYKSTWTACQVMCNSDPKCKGWTWSGTGWCQKKTNANFFYQLHYLSGSRTPPGAATGSPAPGGTTGDTGAAVGTSSDNVPSTKTSSDPPAPAPTDPPEVDWWRQASPLGVEWWVVIAAALVLVMVMSAGMMMMMSMSA